MNNMRNVFNRQITEPYYSLQKKINFRKAIQRIVKPDLNKLGFNADTTLLCKSKSGRIYEFSRIKSDYIEFVVFSNNQGTNPYIKTHIEMMNEILISFFVLDRKINKQIKFESEYRTLNPTDDMFPWNSAWVYFNQKHMEEVISKCLEVLLNRGLKWFDLVRIGIRGEPLLEILGKKIPPLTKEEYNASHWRQRFIKN